MMVLMFAIYKKINKHTMVTEGDVAIPKCTDDMTQK